MLELKILGFEPNSVIFLPGHPASFTHNLVSGMQSFNFVGPMMRCFCRVFFCNQKVVKVHKLGAGSFNIESRESPGSIVTKL